MIHSSVDYSSSLMVEVEELIIHEKWIQMNHHEVENNEDHSWPKATPPSFNLCILKNGLINTNTNKFILMPYSFSFQKMLRVRRRLNKSTLFLRWFL